MITFNKVNENFITNNFRFNSSDPNLIGEILRDKFFKQDKENGKFGCYSTFELRENVVELLGKGILITDLKILELLLLVLN